jgi:hypothetical protein
MSERTPPPLAVWLLTRCSSGTHRESLAGDLIEEFNRGRSERWLWRQVLIAVVQPLAAPGLLKRLLRVLAVIALGAGTLTWASTVHHDECATAACEAPAADPGP